MIQTAKAIVLRTTDVKESSRIATLLTDQYGKIAVMARGARRPKNASAGVFEVGNIIEIVYYFKSTRSVQTVKEASIHHKTYQLRSDFEKQAVVAPTLELLDQLVHESEDSEALYTFAENMIRWINETDEPVQNLFPYIQVRVADLMGLGLQLLITEDAVNSEGDLEQDLYLTIDHGLVAPEAHSSNAFKLTPLQTQFLILALQAKSSRILHVSLEKIERKNLIRHLDVYLQYHIEGVRDRRSDKIFEQLL
jgi:DNA repair protein RecO (recombination protein O)